MRVLGRFGLGACVVAATFALLAAPTGAHEERDAGGVNLTVGWANEPTYVGHANAVQVVLTDGAGNPIRDLGDTLRVEVIFGDQRYGPAVLQPAFGQGYGQPGEYHVPLIPTRPGTYTFHITGTVRGAAIDQSFTSGDDTFDEPRTTSEIEFPARDPSPAELATRIEQLDGRVEAMTPTRGVANFGRTVGLVAVVLALAAFAVAVLTAVRRS